jgi:GT2 family glycosyltransferase
VRATEPASLPLLRGFTRARSFHVSAERLAAAGLMPACGLRVRGADGRDLLGSPLDPGWERLAAEAAAGLIAAQFAPGRLRVVRKQNLRSVHSDENGDLRLPVDSRFRGNDEGGGDDELGGDDEVGGKGEVSGKGRVPKAVAIPADVVGNAPASRSGRRRPVDVVVPVHGAPEMVRACLDSVLASVRAPTRVVVVDDASTEPELVALLDGLLRRKRIRLVRHSVQLGFPASANAGMRACGERDVVLLNSDTLVPPGWLERLRDAVYQAADIGTATPLSNSATILSYPGEVGRNEPPGLAATVAMSRLAHRANAGRIVEIPVAVGFCMYVRRDCLDAVGLFRADLFAQGYGEENDFCLRARHLGWRHVAAAGVYVGHCGGKSFGAAGPALQARNQAILNRLHPGYDRLVLDWAAAEPMAEPFRRFDLARWRADRPRGSGAAILITHADGGGVERRVQESCGVHRAAGRRPIVLRPDPGGDAVVVGGESTETYPHLRYRLPQEMGALIRLLHGEAPSVIELHHVLGHSPAVYDLIAALALPYDVHVHDWVWICPRIILLGPDRRYCGEPDADICDACVADAGRALDEPIPVAALRQRSAQLLSGARWVLVPSEDSARRVWRHFPGVSPVVVAHEDDAALPPLRAPRSARAGVRVCVVGAIGVPKGYDVLLACARDAARRGLPLEFVLVGHSIDDHRLIQTGRVFVTGEFRADEAVTLIQAQDADLALIPSIWPETWCYALTDVWRAGLRAAAFDIGAPAERIRRRGRGFVMPPGLAASRINDAMLAACLYSVHECTS